MTKARMASGFGHRRRGLVLLLVALFLGSTVSLVRAQTPPGGGTGQVAVVTDPEGLNLRAGPGIEFPSLTVLPQGTVLTVLGERVNTTWLPVAYSGQRGFVHTDYIELRAASPTPPPGTGTPGSTGTPAASATPSPAPSGTSTPATPTPTPPPPPPATPAGPLAPPPAAQTDNGVLLTSVTAEDSDQMLTVADAFALTAVVQVPEGVAQVGLRLRGAPFLTYTGAFPVHAGDNALLVPAFRVDTELEPALRDGVIRPVGGTIPIQDGALELTVTYTGRDGGEQTATFRPTVRDGAHPGYVAAIQYPDLKRLTGLPPEGTGQQNYYLRGDADFHHPDNFYVRKLAIEAGRGGGAFPDDPEQVADNIFKFINSTFGDADPGDFNNDANIAQLIDEGRIARGRVNGGYICIAQTYLMTALTRTLGLPSRELNLAIGRASWLGNDGYWRVEWWQEAAVHTWYGGQWNHYDLWLGFKGMNNYFEKNLAYQAWAAFGPQSTPFMTVGGAATGLRGHNFSAWPGDPPHWEFLGEATKPGVRVFGMPEEVEAPVTLGNGQAKRTTAGASALPGPARGVATPPAKGILSPPEDQP